MAVWTISAQEGTGSERIAAELAAAAEVPLLDRTTLSSLARERDCDLPEIDELEACVGHRLHALALGAAVTAGSADALRELQLHQTLPDLGRAVAGEAARGSCVILAPAAFAALPDHPSAVHVRLQAPLAWRIAAYQRAQVTDRRCAEKAVRHDDDLKRSWVKTLYHADIDDFHRFSLVLDASRFSVERIVQTLLAANGVSAADRVAA